MEGKQGTISAKEEGIGLHPSNHKGIVDVSVDVPLVG